MPVGLTLLFGNTGDYTSGKGISMEAGETRKQVFEHERERMRKVTWKERA